MEAMFQFRQCDHFNNNKIKMYGSMGYGGGMGYGGMGYGGGMMQGRGGQLAAPDQQQDQFDFRRELQTTIGKLRSGNNTCALGGLNATLGLAFGVAQMASLGSMSISQ